nr:hypothetical protein [Planococcus glaciei]
MRNASSEEKKEKKIYGASGNFIGRHFCIGSYFSGFYADRLVGCIPFVSVAELIPQINTGKENLIYAHPPL